MLPQNTSETRLPTFEILLIIVLAVLAGAGSLGLFVALRNDASSDAQEALGRGDFEGAVSLADDGPLEVSYLAAAVAARHLLRWQEAEAWLQRVLEDDPANGEALIELALVHLYRRELVDADRFLQQALSHRADLQESITLHRALIAVLGSERRRASLLFEEIEAALETKLRVDFGEGDPAFAEWFLHSAVVWRALGNREKAEWAWRAAVEAAPQSRLPAHLSEELQVWPGPEPLQPSTS